MANVEGMKGRLSKEYVKKEPRDSRTRKPTRRTRPKAVSEAQRRRTAFLHGCKAGMIQECLAFNGCVHCMVPGCKVEAFSYEEAWMALDLHHTVKRSKGHGYKSWDNLGVDDPQYLVLICRPHHDELEGVPWPEKKESA